MARDGELGPAGQDLVAIMLEGAKQGQRADAEAKRARELADELEREVWALSYVLGEIMDGRKINDVVDDLPPQTRRRVIATRHGASHIGRITASDQHGRLPVPPPRAGLMRERVRTIDAEDFLEDVARSWGGQ